MPDVTADNLAPFADARSFGAVLREVGRVAAASGIEAYAVGGAVRDLLLDRPTTDIDFVAVGPGSGIRLAERVGEALGGQTVHVYERFGTAAVRIPARRAGGRALVLEFVGARKESYRRTSRKPIVEAGTLEDDQLRRDFTVNALALHLHPDRYGDVIDPFDGRADLAAGLLRTPRAPERTFADDPLRMVRAARFAAQLGFTIEEETFRAMRAQAARVEILSPERVTDELAKILCAPVPSVGFKQLEASGVLDHVFPELVALKGVEELRGHRHKDNFYHTLEVVDNVAAATPARPCDDVLWLRWAALLHDIAKPLTKRFVTGTGWTFHGHEERGARMIPVLFRRHKLPTDERLEYVVKLVRLHHRPVALVDERVTDSAVRRLLFEAGDDIDDLMLLVRADVTSKNPRRVRRYLAAFDDVERKMAEVEAKDHLRNFQPPVDGAEIMETLGLKEGIAVGIIKENIREAILEGDIPNEHDAAYAYMMRIEGDARRRADLFHAYVRTLGREERAALGALKDAIFFGDLPDDPEAARAALERVKAEALRERTEAA